MQRACSLEKKSSVGGFLLGPYLARVDMEKRGAGKDGRRSEGQAGESLKPRAQGGFDLSAITVSTEKWPLVHQIFDGDQTDQDIERFMKAWEAIIQRGEPCVILSEVRRYSSNPAHIQKLGEWALRVDSKMREICFGGAFVVSSGVFRFVLSSFLLAAPMPYPYTIVKEPSQAAEWLKEKAKEGGLRLPSVL